MGDVVSMDRWRIVKVSDPESRPELFKVEQCFVDLDKQEVFFAKPKGISAINYSSVEQARESIGFTRWGWLRNQPGEMGRKIPVIEYVQRNGEVVRV